jgi:hypothetical protein
VRVDRLRVPFGRLAVVASGLLVVGCGLLPSSGPAVHVDNQTNTPMAVHVNGAWVGTYAPGASSDVPMGGQGAAPYKFSVHSPSGNSLMDFVVTADDITRATEGGISIGTTGLPCGEVRMAIGPILEPPGPVATEGLPTCP